MGRNAIQWFIMAFVYDKFFPALSLTQLFLLSVKFHGIKKPIFLRNIKFLCTKCWCHQELHYISENIQNLLLITRFRSTGQKLSSREMQLINFSLLLYHTKKNGAFNGNITIVYN